MTSGLVDCHTHTVFSFDSESPVGELCEKAVKYGLAGLCLTDHCEICEKGLNELWSYEAMAGSFAAAREYGAKYSGRLAVLAGLELGQPMHNAVERDRLLGLHDYDFLLASVHYLRDGRDFYYLDYIKECDPAEVYSCYLDEILETVGWGGFDSLAHLTYPLRFSILRDAVSFDRSAYAGKYDEILSLLAEKGLALEINTKALPVFEVPELSLLKSFKSLGGELLTIGSDAHTPGALANGFDVGVSLARAAGFGELVYYKNRRPVSVSIR